MFKYNDYNKTRYGIVASVLKNVPNDACKEILLFIFLMDSRDIPIKILEAVYDSPMELLFYLKKYFMATVKGETISVHRKTQHMGLRYISESLGDKCVDVWKKILATLIPYERLHQFQINLRLLVPHLKSLLEHMNKFNLSDSQKIGFRITRGRLKR
jgi:hypothetical protein